ncbi:RNA polymerase sigma factor [Massilia sp. TS11]|uniref:RNA polymerase sigma factor n=1 Tax=Massilia sp. TS11 TaxID=2908003 RepID=UPI001EDB01C5|nr:RNA polymerase sigma factor [Massilia sp. TS11]MCG2585048.1 RNA polymerase sigma factor [Massilia sp. TS11]
MPDLTDTPDHELVRQMRAGTAAAFQALYRRHQGPLFRFALLRCGAEATAADVVQDTFMALLTGSIQFDPLKGALGPFLFGVARNLILKHEAARQRYARLPGEDEDDEPDLASDAAEPLDQLLGQETADAVRRALGQLAPHYRDVLILYELHELSYLEIAQICQVDLGTVRSRLSRARSQLAKRLLAHRSGAPA